MTENYRPTFEAVRSICSRFGETIPTSSVLVGIPRGGLQTASLIAVERPSKGFLLASSDEMYDGPSAQCPYNGRRLWVIDDICVTGSTLRAVQESLRYVVDGVAVLYLKTEKHYPRHDDGALVGAEVDLETWVQFPWERSESGPEDAVRRLIEYVGADPSRPSLQDTPARYLRFLDELREAGAAEITNTRFETLVGDLVVTARIPFASLCEHHMLPYWGEASVGYIPHGRLIGLSKTARILAKHAAGLTLQEHLTHAVAAHVAEAVSTSAVAVVTTAVHTCMVVRGARAIGSRTSASAMLGMFRESPALRAEFFAIVEGANRL